MVPLVLPDNLRIAYIEPLVLPEPSTRLLLGLVGFASVAVDHMNHSLFILRIKNGKKKTSDTINLINEN